ncbi:hypothetical protein OOK58_26685 [Streptomyces sp. NBC_01728]|uniref:ABC transporter permease n=1 Tax=unclassified Streptomyces TaxID=2593676 RepID=UPI002254C1DC|nr:MULTISPECIES: hypothetical protein [unclassified Streptomyces]MCX4455578.1 hypothetical protein [Streptomyces sp. NBC_01719]MCX4494938.1 hypothetical protein [Streptomyces sp. NBC_01728]
MRALGDEPGEGDPRGGGADPVGDVADLGIAVVVSVAVVKQWTPVLDLRLALGAPLAGALVGLLAGLYPSLRAARMEPVDALRAPS